MSEYNYAASLAAQKVTSDSVTIDHTATVFIAKDDAEAKQCADTIALEAYPLEDGWSAHNSVVLRISGSPTRAVNLLTFGDETFGVVTPAEDDPT